MDFALYSSAGTASLLELELVWLEEDGDLVRIIDLNGEELACQDKSCAPPPIGTGGSKPSAATDAKAAKKAAKKARDEAIAKGASEGDTVTGAPGLTEDKLDSLFPGRDDTHKFVHENGTLSIGGLDANGNSVAFSDKTEAKLQKQWDDLGPEKQAYIENLVAAGKVAIGVDLKTGEIVDVETMKQGLEVAKWYTTAHNDAQSISDDTGIDMDHVVAATTVLSAGRQWSGTKSGNAETARALADLAANPRDIEVSQAALDLMEWKREKSTKGPGQIGLHNDTPPLKSRLEAGKKVNSNDLDSATLVELMYATNATRGYNTFSAWAEATTANGKIGMKTPPMASKVEPPYPYFTSKGTHQVKQAMALMRGEVSAREAITGPKYSSFYSNIRRPDVDYSITNDVWQYRIQAGNLPLTKAVTPRLQAKLDMGPTATGTIAELTLGSRAITSAQDLFQIGVSSKSEGLGAGDGMFRDSTTMMRTALNRLKVDYPAQFGTMKGHEFQALIWVHFGGGVSSSNARISAWDAGLEQMREIGL